MQETWSGALWLEKAIKCHPFTFYGRIPAPNFSRHKISEKSSTKYFKWIAASIASMLTLYSLFLTFYINSRIKYWNGQIWHICFFIINTLFSKTFHHHLFHVIQNYLKGICLLANDFWQKSMASLGRCLCEKKKITLQWKTMPLADHCSAFRHHTLPVSTVLVKKALFTTKHKKVFC